MTRLRLDRLSPSLLAAGAFVAAALVASLIAWGAALVIENRSAAAVTSRLMAEGITWAEVRADGLLIRLAGTAPNEATRYRAVNLTGTVVEASRIRDDLEVAPARAIEAPRFSVEMLRNDDGIQLIGLLPDAETVQALTEEATQLSPDIPVSDMLETAAYPAPDSFAPALEFGRAALKLLPRSKISVAADRVAVTAIAASEAEKRQLEAELARMAPQGLQVDIAISAPRPVLTPFTLRFLIDAQGARFDACSADSERARDRIMRAAAAAGMTGGSPCVIGLGVPTPRWAEAIEAGIRAIGQLGGGSVSFSDADVTLLAAEGTEQALFDRVVGELQTALPPVFSLDATLPRAENAASGPAEFTAVLDQATGGVELRGRLTDDLVRKSVDAFARVQFGASKVYVATRLDPELPDGWPVRVLAGLEALSLLDGGKLLVRADTVEISGVTGSQLARARIAQILSGKLGQGQTYRVDVRYDEALDPLAALPTPEECAAAVAAVLARQKITFTPGSAEIDASAGTVMDALAAALADCPGIRMEIAGHTDSQGSEGGNKALSQARAEAVLLSLQGRQVDVSGLTATGYGEAVPIADNETEEGREANRRIEFTLKDTVGQAPAAKASDAASPEPSAEGGAKPSAGSEAAAGTPDFSADDSPSVAPAEKTRRPPARPKREG